jgi:DNA-binding FrmR family transcriptional regulator
VVFLGGQAASGIAHIQISAATSMPVLLAGNLLYTWAIIAASVTMRALRQVLVPRELLGDGDKEKRGRLRGILERMVDDNARDRAIYHALKAVDEVAAALQSHLIEEHGAGPERAATQSTFTNSLKLLRQARERLGEGLRAVGADRIAESDEISLRNL